MLWKRQVKAVVDQLPMSWLHVLAQTSGVVLCRLFNRQQDGCTQASDRLCSSMSGHLWLRRKSSFFCPSSTAQARCSGIASRA